MRHRVAAASLPEPEELGPAMLALDEKRRRFVIGYVANSKDATNCAREAGYEGTIGSLRVQAHRLLHNPKVIAGVKEWADRKLNSSAYVAAAALEEIANDPDHRDRLKAADSILDRVGYPRRQVCAVVPEEESYSDKPTAELLDLIHGYARENYPDLCTRDGAGREVVDTWKAIARLKARVAAEVVSRQQPQALAYSEASNAAE